MAPWTGPTTVTVIGWSTYVILVINTDHNHLHSSPIPHVVECISSSMEMLCFCDNLYSVIIPESRSRACTCYLSHCYSIAAAIFNLLNFDSQIVCVTLF